MPKRAKACQASPGQGVESREFASLIDSDQLARPVLYGAAEDSPCAHLLFATSQRC